MTLSEKQRHFTHMIGKLIVWAYENGLELTFGEAYRTPEMQRIYLAQKKTQVKSSKHQLRLAVDFNLFKNGEYITDSVGYTDLGTYWKSLDPLNVWGGDWRTLKDGNHVEYAG
jgi:hypothetical protein